MAEETYKEYIQRMTRTTGELFEPTGWISIHRYKYRNKAMLFIECYTDCIYAKGQPVALFWMTQSNAVWSAYQLLKESQIWNNKRCKKPEPEADNGQD